MSPYEYKYSVMFLKKFKLKEKRDIIYLQYIIESDLCFLINTCNESVRYQKIIKNIAENIYGYIQFKLSNYIYEKNIDNIIDDYNNRINILITVINDFIIYIKNI
jgi:hypothetical protein